MTAAAEAAPSSDDWRSDPLAFLIAPHDGARFIAEAYERAPLIVRRQEPARFSRLLSIAAIDRLVATADLREGMLDLANAARNVQRPSYVTPAGFIDRGAVADEFQRGSTIILQQLQNADGEIADFCRALEHLFSCHVQTNIYLTPPSAQGFRTHYDNHDVFVLQVEGEKRWRFYDTPIQAPYRGEGFVSAKTKVGPVSEEFVLKAGDSAYVPRGLLHDAQTSGDAPSLHITVGLITRTWADLILEAVSEAALTDPDFRRSLPPGYAQPGFDRAAAQAHFAALIARLPARAGMDGALDLLVDGFIRSRAADTSGAILGGAAAMIETDRFRARRFAPWRLADDEDRLLLIAPGGEIVFDAKERAALERALSGDVFAASEVSIAIAKRLFAFGLLERCA